jgi:hypothetical protein
MGGELVVAMYTVLLGDEWDTKLPNTLKRRLLTYNYTMPQRFEYDLDVVHRQVSIYTMKISVNILNNF